MKRGPVSALGRFVATESAGGVVLLAATAVALVWANSPIAASYEILWTKPVVVGIDARNVVNDGLITLFFFVAGLEIRREVTRGELYPAARARLPVIAAVGGMVVPAILYLLISSEPRGWGIPMATEIAVVAGVLTLVGNRIPPGPRVFLIAVAIVDDVGAIVVMGLFYSAGIAPVWLAGAAIALLVIRFAPGFLIPFAAIAAGWATYQSGVHPGIAGVAVAAVLPSNGARLDRIEHRIHPYTSLVVIPLFALANAGIFLGSGALSQAVRSRVFAGVVAGLVAGKMIGITLATLAAVKFGLARMPRGMTPRTLVGVAALGGIGFTASLFITELAFDGTAPSIPAKLGVLTASLIAGLIGTVLLLARSRPASDPG